MTDSKHSPLPWITSPCGDLCPDDIMIYADLGKNEMGSQTISTVGKVLSLRQSKEVTAANAAFIVKACNAHAKLVAALEALIAQVNDYERINNLAPAPGRSECWDTVAHAKSLLASLKEPA